MTSTLSASSKSSKKIYVLDTNVLLDNANSIFSFKNSDIILPLRVIVEIDNFKKGFDNLGVNARKVSRILDDLSRKQDLMTGVSLGKGKGRIRIVPTPIDVSSKDLDKNVTDHSIILIALQLQRDNPNCKIKVISNDTLLRILANSNGIAAEDYVPENIVDSADQVYGGLVKVICPDSVIDDFYSKKEIMIDEVVQDETETFPQQFLMLTSDSNEKHTALARYVGANRPLKQVIDYKVNGVQGIRPRNKEQNLALNLLLDPEVDLVSMVGIAGTGKSLMALAAGLEMVIGRNPVYHKMVICRPLIPVGKDLGFLPGDLEAKMDPWLAPVKDNFELIMAGKTSFQEAVDIGTIVVEPISYIRGRSMPNCFFYIDECQNLFAREAKTLLTRSGENTKVVMAGDIFQTDNINVTATSNGLVYVVERLKKYDCVGHITLVQGERSRLANIAAEAL